MDMNITSASNMVSNPAPAVVETLEEASSEAKAALETIGLKLSTSASTEPVTERVQIVDEEKKFSKELTPAISRWGLIDKGFGYDVVAVFGSQSTGKSTLLNRLFGTTFDVMDETQRKQTTKGIWMCRAKNSPIMVMDVEGTDGRERGEDQDFERKSALFSLASSEVLLINIWEHQVGLYQGANMGLLKTVFEVNLGLFGVNRGGGTQKTLLMFVIRDHIGVTPLANLKATLSQDMDRIWSSLAKPEALSSAAISDYFDLDFTTLPHKVLMPEKFESEVIELRKRFEDRSRPDYIFKASYHKRIPADGVAFYMEGIWDQVQTNKDLDLPTQQELLAQFRCDEIAAVAIDIFMTSMKPLKRPIETGALVEELGASMSSWKMIAVAAFDKDASRYHTGVYTRKKTDLVATIDTALSPLFLGYIKNLHKNVVASFKSSILASLKKASYDFGEVVKVERAAAEKEFEDGAKEALLPGTDWQYESEFDTLKEDLSLIGSQLRSDETQKMVNSIERNIKKQLTEPIGLYLNKPSPNMWDRVLSTFKDTLERAEFTYLAKAKSFNCTEEENTTSLAVLRRRSWLALRTIIDSQTADNVLLGKLRIAFEEKFRYDESGVPRVWKPEDDIDSAFKKAKDETLLLIPIYSHIKPIDPSLSFALPSDSAEDALVDPDAEFDFPSSLVVLSATKEADLEVSFKREADALYVEAKRSMVVSRAMIPLWIWGLMGLLGFNEFVTVITNPLYFISLILLGVSAYAVYVMGLSGPLLQVTNALYKEVNRIATEKLREAFAEVPHQQSHSNEKVPVLAQQSQNSSAGESGPREAELLEK